MELTDIIDRFRGPLIGLIASWGANCNDAAEIAQDSFADAYLNRDSCRGNWQDPEVFGAWLLGIARNQFRNAIRSWSVPAVWLQQSGVPLDLSKPRALFQEEIEGEQNPYTLGVASRTGPVAPADVASNSCPIQDQSCEA